MDTTPPRKTRQSLQYGALVPRTRFKVQETRCPACMGSGTDSKTRLPGGVLWVQPCEQCHGAGAIERQVAA